VGSVNEIFTWFKRSLAHHQEPSSFELEDAQGLLDDLRDMEMVEFKGNYVKPHITGLGKVSAWLYYSPYDVHGWYHNFAKYFEADERDDMLLCWAVADIDSNNWGYVPADLRNIAEDWAWKLRNRGVQASDAVASAIAAWYCITGQKPEGTLGPLTRNIKYDIRRMAQAISLIDSMYAKWERKDMWDSLAQRIMYGISEDMVELVQVDGIGGVTARKLYERGVCTLADLAMQENLKTVMQVASPARAKAWMMQARKLM
jgi:replicative superfamily II helicase